MKQLLLLILTITFTSFSFGQNTDLLDEDWNLIKIVIDGQDIFPPNEQPDIMLYPFELNFVVDNSTSTGFDMSDSYCANGGRGEVSFSGANAFLLPEGYIYLAGGCDTMPSRSFETDYQTMYGNSSFDESYTYAIQDEDDGDLGLIVTKDADGMQAFYTNGEVLGVSDNTAMSFNIFPNPTQETINITSETPVNHIKIYSLQGKVVFEDASEDIRQINIQDLSTGVYFLEVASEGKTALRKFMKR